jgi:hypothetical protein
MAEYFDTSVKKVRKGRGMAQKSLALIKAMAGIVEATHPITGRGVGYKLFTAGLIPSMSPQDMQRVYRLLKEAREKDMIPWGWIVDEGRDLERTPSWDDPDQFAQAATRQYRRDSWNQQPVRCEIWSEKGTVRGVLAPVLDEYGVGFRVNHGFSSATVVHDIADDDDGRPLIAFYVGDLDPSGLYMSERDLPERLDRYGGAHVEIKRIALTRDQLTDLPSFSATDKLKDPRFKWFCENFGSRCWELDALDPNELRDCVERHIKELIEPIAWQRCRTVMLAEQNSLTEFMTSWAGAVKPDWIAETLDYADIAGKAA